MRTPHTEKEYDIFIYLIYTYNNKKRGHRFVYSLPMLIHKERKNLRNNCPNLNGNITSRIL